MPNISHYFLARINRPYGVDGSTSIGFRKISREHIKLEKQDNGTWVLLDMGSHSGTKVNGKKAKQVILKPGDQIDIGTTRIVFKASNDNSGGTVRKFFGK